MYGTESISWRQAVAAARRTGAAVSTTSKCKHIELNVAICVSILVLCLLCIQTGYTLLLNDVIACSSETHSNGLFLSVGAGGNRQHESSKDTAALDRETEELKHATLSLDVGKAIMQVASNHGR